MQVVSYDVGRYAAQKCNSAATNCKKDENYQVNVDINNACFKMLEHFMRKEMQ